MNQQFILSRFGLFLRYYWSENGKNYLISLGLVIGIMLFLMIPIVGTTHYNDMLFILHIIGWFGGMFLGGSLFTSTSFNAYAVPERGISAIMLPVSRLEKFTGILLAHLLFVVVVFVIGYLLHHGLCNWANEGFSEELRGYEPAPNFVIVLVGFTYFLLQAAVFLGSIYFPKNSYIKTLGVILVLITVAFVFNLLLAYHFTGYPQSVMAFPFTSWNVIASRRYMISYPTPIGDLVKLLLVLIVIALGYITFVRLKEKEI